METNKKIFLHGMHDGIPIGIGYFAVAFSLGITARDCGFNAFQGFLSSITTYASAGQFIGYTLYAANATLLQLAIMTVITNARYLLMGFALNQRLPQGTPLYKRMLCGVAITDEIFGITIARPGYVNPFYPLGALVTAAPMWSCGIALGITMGNLLPLRLVSALSVALFGMFLAVIIPPSRKQKPVRLVVILAAVISVILKYTPGLRNIPSGYAIILCAVAASTVGALLFPVADEEEEGKEA
jgi:predicted branched-subunit amino acid permease